MLGLDLGHMAINKWNPISFSLILKLNLFYCLIPNGYYIFMFIVFSNNFSAFFYIVWINGMKAKQYGIKINYNLTVKSSCNLIAIQIVVI